MAAVRFLNKSRTALAYCNGSGLRVVACHIAQQRTGFSSDAKRGVGSRERAEDTSSDKRSGSTVWPDPNLGLLGPQDRRLPLPGNVGLENQLFVQQPSPNSAVKPGTPAKRQFVDCDVLTSPSPQERQVALLTQLVQSCNESNQNRGQFDFPATGDILNCVAQDCPQLIRKDFGDLFPGFDAMLGYFTVMTLSRKAITDVSESYLADIEQEELMLYFVIAAEDICAQLKEHGYWADFIDPSSGRPYLTRITSSTLLETERRYRHLGFMIEDLGQCKVVTHHAWGPHVFVGCLFTNAPATSQHLKAIIDNHNSGGHQK